MCVKTGLSLFDSWVVFVYKLNNDTLRKHSRVWNSPDTEGICALLFFVFSFNSAKAEICLPLCDGEELAKILYSPFLSTLFILHCRPPALMQWLLARSAMLEARGECSCVRVPLCVCVCVSYAALALMKSLVAVVMCMLKMAFNSSKACTSSQEAQINEDQLK